MKRESKGWASHSPFTALTVALLVVARGSPDAPASFHLPASLIIAIYLPGQNNKVIAPAINNY